MYEALTLALYVVSAIFPGLLICAKIPPRYKGVPNRIRAVTLVQPQGAGRAFLFLGIGSVVTGRCWKVLKR